MSKSWHSDFSTCNVLKVISYHSVVPNSNDGFPIHSTTLTTSRRSPCVRAKLLWQHQFQESPTCNNTPVTLGQFKTGKWLSPNHQVNTPRQTIFWHLTSHRLTSSSTRKHCVPNIPHPPIPVAFSPAELQGVLPCFCNNHNQHMDV